jgi:cyclophilin family peptidyl-prolyl cis-trans isomerase
VKRLLEFFFASLLLLGSLAAAQVDDVVYNQAAQRLSYLMDYDRILENAEARECSSEAFANSLLHTVLRTLFLYLPYEASFYEGVAVVEVRAIQDDGTLVLYATAPLNEMRDTNTRFRVFMNSLASSRSGFCFTAEGGVLESWMSTLTARGGILAVNTDVLEPNLTGWQDLAETNVPALDEVASQEPVAQEAPPPTPQPEATSQAETPPQAEPTPQAETPHTPTVQRVNGFSVVPYLSTERVLSFTASQNVLQPNTDYMAVFETSKGTMTVDLLEQQTPITVNNFVFLALNQYYDGVSIFRVLDGFIAQSGDPTGTGVGGPGYQFSNEIAAGFSHSTTGVLSMANAGPDNNGSQFFFTLSPQPQLDGSYSIFGAVIEGLNVLNALTPTDPTTPIALASLDSTLGLLETQGVSLDGNDGETLGSHLTRTLGTLPNLAQRFSVGNYDAIIGSDGQSETPTVAFWPKSDVIQHIYIIAKPR